MDAARLRDEFPVLRDVAYLNAGTCGPVPAAAVDAVRAEVERQAVDGRARRHFERRLALQRKQREAYAGLLACNPEDVALTTSTSEGVATAVAGLGLGRGDEILTSDEEHLGLIGPLQAARDVRGVGIRVAPRAQLADAVGPRTKVVACTHVGWMSGAVAPPALADLDVPVLFDGAQGVGAVPVDVGALGCDVYAGSGQKWLCGPDGTGMLYVSPEMRERISPIARSYITYANADAGLDAELHPDARRYDTPSLPAESEVSALTGLAALGSFGWEAVHARGRGLAATLADGLRERGHEVAPRADTTLVSWRCEDAEGTRDRLGEAGIVIRNLPGRSLLRASVGAWNDESDLERLLAALPAP
jgi:L-cysteine/cystine lyase